MKTVKNRQCRTCDGTEFDTAINFGSNPLVNSLIEAKDLDKKEPVFPLVVKRCRKCNLVQVLNVIDSDEIYRKIDYLYFTGDMPQSTTDYFKAYAEEIEQRFLKEGDFVVEIGSNDGTMMKFFSEKIKKLGVDPASNVALRALKNGLLTLSDGFNLRIAKSIEREFGKAKVIYGNNCIAHINDLRSVVDGVRSLLADDGIFIVECNYWGGMVKNRNYALIYHDHFSYFSAQNWADFAPKYGLRVFDAYVTPAQGGSLRIFMTKNQDLDVTERCFQLLDDEKITDLNTKATCDSYRRTVKKEAKKLHQLVYKLKSEGKKIAGYGAAAKGFSVLKLANITNELDYFVDDSKVKQGKYTPVNHISVISREEAESKLPDYFFITAPNYEKDILAKEENFRAGGGKFITVDCRII